MGNVIEKHKTAGKGDAIESRVRVILNIAVR